MSALENMLRGYWAVLNSPLVLTLLAVGFMIWAGQRYILWQATKESRTHRD